MLELKDISISVADRQLFKLDLVSLQSGVIALVGRNGSGKSTFIRTILGEHNHFSGSVFLNGKRIQTISPAERAKLMAVVYSRANLFGNHTVKEVLMLGRLPYQNMVSTSTQQDQDQVNQVAKELNLENWLEKPFQVLSDGEKQLVMIGRALVQDTPVILMDEPAAFLDMVNRYELSKLLKRVSQNRNKLILFSTHQLERLEKDCDGVLLIDGQHMRFIQQQDQFLKSIHQAFGIE